MNIDDLFIQQAPADVTVSLQKRVEEAKRRLVSFTIENDQQLAEAGEFLSAIKATAKSVDAAFAEEKAATYKTYKDVMAKIAFFQKPLESVEIAVRKLMNDYITRRDRERREQERLLRAQEEERLLAQAEATGDDKVLEQPLLVVHHEPDFTISTFEHWDFELVDISKVDPKYLIVDERAVRAIVKQYKGDAQPMLGEGIKVTCERRVRSA